jgi:ABC-2 type transport system ATP-binding protein
MIITKNVSKYFGKVEALKDVSFEISKGEIVGFLGKNGAGKTTLMRILTSYLPATSGKVFIFGEEIMKSSLNVRKNIGYLSESPPLYPNMTAREYLKFAAQLKDIPVKKLRGCIDKVLDDCRLLYVQNKMIAHLSKGYRQRIGIAQAIINEPEVLILDEPTNGLDPVQIQQVRKLIRNIEYKRTVIISTHILSEIEQITRRVIIINSGEIIRDEMLDHLLESGEGRRKLRVRFKGERGSIELAIRAAENLKQMDIDSRDNVHTITCEMTGPLDHYNEVVQMLLKANGQILEIEEVKLNLEDVFLRLNPPQAG